MRRPAAAVLALIALVANAGAAWTQNAPVAPRKGVVITRSTTIRPGTYRLASHSLDSAVIVIRGSDLTVNLAGVDLAGASDDEHPDAASGLAILVDGGTNVTIRGGRIRGYKVAILARGTHNLRLLDSDLSFNWKPRLYSGVEHESLVDWLSYHHNEKDEWLRYGAAVYLRGVRGGEIKGVTVHQGMNGLLITDTDSLLVWNNDFSFNSGLGIGLYRSSHNRVMHNRVDFNVRGYSEGFYRRGQDSAGILIYEQSDSNVVAFNSATHSGDGLFLWAGQHTMDTGEGGANDNVFFRNDFSFAPTNAMEATFSRNVFLENTATGSDYGLWGGYSFSSLVAANKFADNRIGLAIEHGQDNQIIANTFDGDSTAISLWANAIEPSDWGYPKHRDTRSRDYLIADNALKPHRVALRIRDTRNARVERNAIAGDSTLVIGGDTTGFALTADTTGRPSHDFSKYAVAPLAGAQRVSAGVGAWPRSTIVVDEWGPYDWRYPRLWPVDSGVATPLRLKVLGPRAPGDWRVLRARGATLSRDAGKVGDIVRVRPAAGPVEDWDIALEYRGAATRSPRGVVRPARTSYVFTYSRFDPRATWAIRVYAWSDSTHPLKAPAALDSLLTGSRGAPVVSQTTQRLDYMWYRPRVQGWPQDKAAVVATTEVTLPAGAPYTLRTISDDGIRVWVDDALVIEDWTVHESKVIEVPIAPGRHRVRVHYFQETGWTELRVEFAKHNSTATR